MAVATARIKVGYNLSQVTDELSLTVVVQDDINMALETPTNRNYSIINAVTSWRGGEKGAKRKEKP